MNISITKSDSVPNGYELSTELCVTESRSEVFEFFADAFQLERITPPWLNFSVQSPRPIRMQAGTLIDYKLRLHGLPIRWRSRISHWEPLFSFVDEQVKGPYRGWHHLHTFEEVDSAGCAHPGTLVRDIVNYSVPLSAIMHPLIVRGNLRRIFEFRRQALSRIFTPAANVTTHLESDR